MRTREEHLAWCKTRALEYVEKGDLPQALTSMGSDMSKHPETDAPHLITLGIMLLINGSLSSRHEMTEFINGFR